MEYSVIVPAFNASKTIRACLDAIFSSESKNFEVLVIDDRSTDETVAIAKEFPCRVIQLDTNVGPAHARDRGKREARSDILVFIDADIVIKSDTLSQMSHAYTRDPGLAAVVGLLAKDHPKQNFWSTYKNLYMHYIFSKCPQYIDFIYGSFFSIKKQFLELPKTLDRFGEDTELGMILHSKDCKILLDKTLEVVHLKRYTLFSFVRNDFRIPCYWAKLFIQQKGLAKVITTRRFFHAQLHQLASIVLAPAILFGSLIHPPCAAILLLFFVLFNGGFFLFLYKERGMLFAVRAAIITWLDMLVMGIGIMGGMLSSLCQRCSGN
jgi:glycosyltransferase involved in cell wall biosynthesis